MHRYRTMNDCTQIGDACSEFNLVEPKLLPPPRLSLKKRTYTGERRQILLMPSQISARSITPDLLLPLLDEDSVDVKQDDATSATQDDCFGFIVSPCRARPYTPATPSSPRQDDGDRIDISTDPIDPEESCPKRHRTKALAKSLLSPLSISSSLVSAISSTLDLSKLQSGSLDDTIEELNGRLASIAPLSTAPETEHCLTKFTTRSFAHITTCNTANQMTHDKQFGTDIVAPSYATDDSIGGKDRSTSFRPTELSWIPYITEFVEGIVTPTKSAPSFRMRPRKHVIAPDNSLLLLTFSQRSTTTQV